MISNFHGGYFSTTSAANPEAHFSLENVSSQLDKLFPKEDIFKQMFDKWQTESSNMDNEKYKLPMIAEAVLNEISTKAKELKLHFTFRFVTSCAM